LGGKLSLDSNHCWVDVSALERRLHQMRRTILKVVRPWRRHKSLPRAFPGAGGSAIVESLCGAAARNSHAWFATSRNRSNEPRLGRGCCHLSAWD
jgi:hypothetical protein